MAIERGGKSIGDQLIAEGLAHRYVNASRVGGERHEAQEYEK